MGIMMLQSTQDSQLKDRISELPDDVLTNILSHLSLREVACNSVISHKWRYLWRITPRLDLDNYKNADECCKTDADQVNYVKWVNRILKSHECEKLHEVRIRYELKKHFKSDIDSWVKFVFSKQVQIFDLDMDIIGCPNDRMRIYSLTPDLIETVVNQQFNGFQYLKELRLKHVKISDDLVELILKKSPLLEVLSILKQSLSLSVVRVSGPQCVLKCLEISYGIKCLEISDVASLVSLKYIGQMPQTLMIKNVPKLIDFYFGGYIIYELFDLKLNDLLAQFSCSLKYLTLDISNFEAFENYMSLPKMTALEKLVVQTSFKERYTSWYASLTTLCPSLKEFVFQAHSHEPIIDLPDAKIRTDKSDPAHECLKKVTILGYYGLARDVEIVLYFIHTAVSLQTIVIDPHDQTPFIHGFTSPPNTQIEQLARIRAKEQLKGKVPSRVDLVIL